MMLMFLKNARRASGVSMRSRRGGLPRGRPTLICGSAGSGKTLFAMEFLMRGARDYGEPGVFMTFEETSGGSREELHLPWF